MQEMIASLSLCGRDILSQGSLLAIYAPESCLNGRAYAAAGQTVASLHTMAYQTDLLKRPGYGSKKSRSEPEQPGVLAHLGLRIRDGLRRLVS